MRLSKILPLQGLFFFHDFSGFDDLRASRKSFQKIHSKVSYQNI